MRASHHLFYAVLGFQSKLALAGPGDAGLKQENDCKFEDPMETFGFETNKTLPDPQVERGVSS